MQWLKQWLRRWLGITDDYRSTCSSLVGLRQDHEALVNAHHEWKLVQKGMVEAVAGTLNRTTIAAAGLERRVAYYEHTVPALVRARKAYDAQVAKERKKAEREAAKEDRPLAVVKDGESAVDAQREAAAGVADA